MDEFLSLITHIKNYSTRELCQKKFYVTNLYNGIYQYSFHIAHLITKLDYAWLLI